MTAARHIKYVLGVLGTVRRHLEWDAGQVADSGGSGDVAQAKPIRALARRCAIAESHARDIPPLTAADIRALKFASRLLEVTGMEHGFAAHRRPYEVARERIEAIIFAAEH